MLENNIDVTLDLEEEILRLKKELNAVILAHYYQESEIQDLADFVGDSLDLAKKAKSTDAEVIVFAGVHFMAETAKILNPDKLVLLPDTEAGCSLAESCPPGLFKPFREKHPEHLAITYINCTAEVKALSDIICTSSNAEKIINQIPADQPILFSPDRNLGKYLIKKTGREMLLWDGTCIVHETFSERKIIDLKLEHPDAKIIAHPECEDIILIKADFIGSTSKLLNFVKEDKGDCYIVATESGILHQMKKAEPNKTFIPAPPEKNCSCNECPYMRLNTLEKLYLCMKNKMPRIEMSKDLMQRALKPIERMLEMS
jgi:quinolinate synthase